MTTLLAAQEQAALAHSVLDITVAEQVLEQRTELLSDVRAQIHTQRQIMTDWIASEPGIEWVEPEGGVVCFPRFVDRGIDARRVYAQLQSAGMFLGPGWWFEQADRHMRIGFGYPTEDELRTGLAMISAAIRSN